jgi:hypothetical protein
MQAVKRPYNAKHGKIMPERYIALVRPNNQNAAV